MTETGWTASSTGSSGITTNANSCPIVADVNGDGGVDLVMGNDDGNVILYASAGYWANDIYTFMIRDGGRGHIHRSQ